MDLHTMTQSSSFVHLRTQHLDKDLNTTTDSILNMPEHKILVRMMQEVPECLNMLQYCTDRLTKRIDSQATASGLTVSHFREAITYLLVYGFVPFIMHDDTDVANPNLSKTSSTNLRPRILHSTDIQWRSKMFDIEQGALFPLVETQLRRASSYQQPYIYFYRPSAASSSIVSMFRKVLPAYRALLAVREYNVMVRRKNATRTLLVNRTLPPPEPSAGFDETGKADFLERSILDTATRLAIDQTNVHIAQDTQQVKFVKDVVNKQTRQAEHNFEHPQYENLLVMPPLCNTEVDHHYTEEIDELNYIEYFRQAFSLIFKIQDLPDIARTDHIRRRARSLQNVQHTNVELGFIEPDLNEFVGLVCALTNDKAYQKQVGQAVAEHTTHRQRQYRVFFSLQSLPLPKIRDDIVLNTPGQKFEVLLNLFDRGLLKREDFATVFRSEIGFDLPDDARPQAMFSKDKIETGSKSGHEKRPVATDSDQSSDEEPTRQKRRKSKRRGRRDASSSSESDSEALRAKKKRVRRVRAQR